MNAKPPPSRPVGLRQANGYNRSLIEASLDPLVTIGPEGKITDVNAATEVATGCSRAELIGTDFSDYFTEPEKARAGRIVLSASRSTLPSLPRRWPAWASIGWPSTNLPKIENHERTTPHPDC
jgi:PAS domain-containing protein